MKTSNLILFTKNMDRNFAAAVSLLYLVTFFHAGVTKVLESSTPSWFIDTFSKTLLGFIPEIIPLSFFAIGYIELLLGLLFFVTIIELFRNPERGMLLFSCGLFLSFLLFIALCFGQRIAGEYNSSAQLFFYALLTFFAYKSLKNTPFKEVETK